jgi:TonB family protein
MEAGTYLLQSTLLISAAIVLYKLLLERLTFFTLNRLYLLGAPLLALLAPLLPQPEWLPSSENGVLSAIRLPLVNAASDVSVTHEGSWWMILYLAGAAVMALRLAIGLIRPGLSEQSVRGAFTFANRTVLPSHLSGRDRDIVGAHESVHRTHGHFADLLLAETVRCFQWFNPLMPVYIRCIRLNHEYAADASALRLTDTETYCNLLLREALQTPRDLIAVHSFSSETHLKSRIAMMYQNRSSLRRAWRYLAVLPLIALALLLRTGAHASPVAAADAETPSAASPGQPASYPGGMDAMMTFLVSNLAYPKEETASGTVVVAFVVEADGNLSDIRVKKSVSALLDKEAVRVVSMMPRWEPAVEDGKKVASELVLPIRFEPK